MSAQSSDLLTHAYDLIEADKLDEAAAILKPILETEKDNPDVWWLYSHAVRDVETARLALNNVLRLDSSYPEAAELLRELDDQSPAAIGDGGNGEPAFLPGIAPIRPKELPGLSSSKTSSDDDDDLDDDEFPDDEDEEREGLSRWGILAAGIIGLLLIAALVYVVARPFSGPSTLSNVTATASIPTLSVADSQSLPTEVPPTLESTLQTDVPVESGSSVSFDADLRSAMSSFTIPSDGIAVTQTSLGQTLLVSVCTSAGTPLREAMPASMVALARANALYATEAVDAIGVRMIDCATNAPLRSIGTALANATGLTDGSLSDREFQSTWVPVS
ncbi:MAG: tetratricopeptide repeat protein [Anaerolineae bacterium]|nr:tetratricopeptide repeat protein [Anaerolineae bacterium]